MASTLTSNPFLPKPIHIPIPNSRLVTFRIPKLTVFAKKSGPFPPFRLSNAGDSSGQDDEESSANSNPFRFDFGKFPDVKSLVPLSPTNPSSGLSFGRQRRKDPGTVFVAGATGLAGIRIAQRLLREGFSVRAGVPDLGAAQELAVLADKYKVISNEEAKRLNAVQSTFQDAESIAKAIGNASKVVVTIGPFENGPTNEVTTSDALQVIQAAELAGVGHVAIVYDGSSMNTSSYNVLDGITSFFNNLFSQSQPLTMQEFLQKIVQTSVSYTLLMTSLTDDFAPESSYNVVVSAEGTAGANDYKVAKSQIAKLVADVFSNTAVAENKVVEVSTDPLATRRTGDELFSVIPEDGRRKAYAEAIAKAKAEEEAKEATEKARQAAKEAKKLEEEVKKLEQQETQGINLAKEAEEKAAAAGLSVEDLLDKAKGFSSRISWEKFNSQLNSAVEKPIDEEPKTKGLSSVGLSWENLSSQLKSVVQKPTKEDEEEPKVRVATVRGQAKARNLPAQKAVVKSPATKPKPVISTKPKAKQADTKPEVRKVFGGLFKQETIYIEDD